MTGGEESRSSCAEGTSRYVTSSCVSLMLAATCNVVSLSAAAEGQDGWKVSFTVSVKLRVAAAAKVLLMLLEPAAAGTKMLSWRG